jgi:REP-associated tyrosine transposase
MTVFFEDGDYSRYLALLSERARRWRVEVWAYCLMPNHVHLIAVPPSARALSHALGEAHRRYAVSTNRPRSWTGHLWQERFRSCALDERHLYAAVRYVLLNPVRAHLAAHPLDWPHSSAAAHLQGRRDPLVSNEALANYVEDWEAYLALGVELEMSEALRRHSRSGQPLMSGVAS